MPVQGAFGAVITALRPAEGAEGAREVPSEVTSREVPPPHHPVCSDHQASQ